MGIEWTMSARRVSRTPGRPSCRGPLRSVGRLPAVRGVLTRARQAHLTTSFGKEPTMAQERQVGSVEYERAGEKLAEGQA